MAHLVRAQNSLNAPRVNLRQRYRVVDGDTSSGLERIESVSDPTSVRLERARHTLGLRITSGRVWLRRRPTASSSISSSRRWLSPLLMSKKVSDGIQSPTGVEVGALGHVEHHLRRREVIGKRSRITSTQGKGKGSPVRDQQSVVGRSCQLETQDARKRMSAHLCYGDDLSSTSSSAGGTLYDSRQIQHCEEASEYYGQAIRSLLSTDVAPWRHQFRGLRKPSVSFGLPSRLERVS